MSKAKANILPDYTAGLECRITSHCPETLTKAYRALLGLGWRFYVVNQSRGRCYYGDKVITIPVWAMQCSKPGYWIYYVAHEVSHAVAGPHANHGPRFQGVLLNLCPAEYFHYEFGYKSGSASKAVIASGVTLKAIDDDLD